MCQKQAKAFCEVFVKIFRETRSLSNKTSASTVLKFLNVSHG